MMYKGYEIAKMLTKGEIPEDTYLDCYMDGKFTQRYVVFQKALWTMKILDNEEQEMVRDYEEGNSMLTCSSCEFKFVKTCNNCGRFVDDSIYHKYHGHCSGGCEKVSINKFYNKLRKEYNPTVTLDLNAREDFFRDVTEEDIKRVAEVLVKNSLRFF